MAKTIKFMSETDEVLLIIKDQTADICKSVTIIFKPVHPFSILRLIETVQSIDIDQNRARINYCSGRYLLVK